MSDLEKLFENNRKWASCISENTPGFFETLAAQQSPEYLWIGCSDSRVPANQIMGLLPGEVFVHRNVANIVSHTDLNCLTVLQYAVDVLQVKHVIVVGHYNCGGVRAAYEGGDNGMIDNWLYNIKDTKYKHRDKIEALNTPDARVDLLCELNVSSQVASVCRTGIVQRAWGRGQQLAVHGLIYGLKDGLLKDLNCSASAVEHIPPAYRTA